MSDKKPKKPKFQTPATIERQYERQLRQVARHSAGIIHPHVHGAELIAQASMLRRVADYVDALDPWARRTSTRTAEAVDASNKRTWKKQSAEIKTALKEESQGRIGAAQRKWHIEQVELIKSIPQDAAARAQALARKAISEGGRAESLEGIIKQMAGTEDYALNKATLIARTEISKANTALTRARSENLGVTHYIWTTVGDADVRDSHAEMEGQICSWEDPPEVEGEGAHHPGDFPNCRCFASPVLPDFD